MYIPKLDYHCDLMNKEFKSVDPMDIETSELVFTDDGIAARAANYEEFPADMVGKDITIIAQVCDNECSYYAAVSFELPLFVLHDSVSSALYKVELTDIEERRIDYLLRDVFARGEATPAAV